MCLGFPAWQRLAAAFRLDKCLPSHLPHSTYLIYLFPVGEWAWGLCIVYTAWWYEHIYEITTNFHILEDPNLPPGVYFVNNILKELFRRKYLLESAIWSWLHSSVSPLWGSWCTDIPAKSRSQCGAFFCPRSCVNSPRWGLLPWPVARCQSRPFGSRRS